MTEYVMGLAFNGDYVAVVRKNRPAWQAGKYNGIGGHIEAGETPIQAMVREFYEETGLKTYVVDWWPFAALVGNEFKVHFFATHSYGSRLHELKTTTDEEILVMPVKDLTVHNSIPNLTWLLPMAKSMPYDRADTFHITEAY